MSHTVYILYSEELDRYYIGFTSGPVQERLQKHMTDHGGFTSKAKDWKIVYTEYFETKVDAVKRERQIKGWKSKQRIRQLIGSSG